MSAMARFLRDACERFDERVLRALFDGNVEQFERWYRSSMNGGDSEELAMGRLRHTLRHRR